MVAVTSAIDDLPHVLRSAVDDGRLVVHLQPEVDLASGALVGMEALARVEHPARGLLWPGDFLPVAEEAGVLPALGWAVIRRCVRELRGWQTLPPLPGGQPRTLWVNVTVSQLLESDFVERIHGLLAMEGVPAGCLGLELSESALATGTFATGLLRDLHAAGVALGIDNVTAWYGHLAALKSLPIDAVKLDRGFVRGVGSEVEGDHIVSSVIELAHAQGLRVVADGVESWSEGARLCELGCDHALGYLFSGPQRPEHARLMLAHGAGWTVPSAGPGRRTGGA